MLPHALSSASGRSVTVHVILHDEFRIVRESLLVAAELLICGLVDHVDEIDHRGGSSRYGHRAARQRKVLYPDIERGVYLRNGYGLESDLLQGSGGLARLRQAVGVEVVLRTGVELVVHLYLETAVTKVFIDEQLVESDIFVLGLLLEVFEVLPDHLLAGCEAVELRLLDQHGDIGHMGIGRFDREDAARSGYILDGKGKIQLLGRQGRDRCGLRFVIAATDESPSRHQQQSLEKTCNFFHSMKNLRMNNVRTVRTANQLNYKCMNFFHYSACTTIKKR